MLPREALFPPQAALLNLGFPRSARHWLIRAPTGSGKTRIAEEALLNAARDSRIGVYIAPLHAILAERAGDWARRLPDLQPLLLSGNLRSSQIKPEPEQLLILCTPEKFNSLLLRWKRHHQWIGRIGCLVLDELHTLGDADRGATIEAAVGRFQRLNPFAQIIGLTGTLANAAEVSAWLRARDFSTDWRPVPLERSIRRFKKPIEKHDILLEELAAVLDAGARALVFVNSRKRSEFLAAALRAKGISAGFLHAGVIPSERTRVCADFKSGNLQTVVATSSLEMGVNLPARAVVIFDSYCFDGEAFGPMPMQRYLQMSGRAGRPGLDPCGQSILLMPFWSGDADAYLKGRLPPLRSSLFSRERLLHEVLLEVASRLSISRRHLETNFAARTFWRSQGGEESAESALEVLLRWDLLKTMENAQGTEFLMETALGRIALQMAAPPVTLAAWREFYNGDASWQPFDLLLRASLMEEVTPRPGFNFEEIDVMGDLLLTVPSSMLDLPSDDVAALAGGAKRLLSAVKAAVILFRRTQGATFEEIAEQFDAYVPDLRMLAENVEWTLETAQRVFAHLARQDWISQSSEEDETSKRAPTPVERLCAVLRAMVRHGVPRDALNLVEVPGIGSKRAMALHREGIRSLQGLLSTSLVTLRSILHLTPATVTKILTAADEIMKSRDIEDPFALETGQGESTLQPRACSLPSFWPSGVDPYRLRRALDLKVDYHSSEVVRLSGGLEPHLVRIVYNPKGHRNFTCDCADFAKGIRQCKHVIRARLVQNDASELLEALRYLVPKPDRPLRYSLGELWMKVGETYDAFHGRNGDDQGRKLLFHALNPGKPR